jgi:hypothetical protein
LSRKNSPSPGTNFVDVELGGTNFVDVELGVDVDFDCDASTSVPAIRCSNVTAHFERPLALRISFVFTFRSNSDFANSAKRCLGAWAKTSPDFTRSFSSFSHLNAVALSAFGNVFRISSAAPVAGFTTRARTK